ncbi:glycoside hydrolase family 16 protein [Allosaccharopolyspora coralli]|uniref:glycoside hydrolase family 16 protein n=1 Tax=Allosaccharopolyspora coralli TaxID=2665642 RepID=UPI001E4AE127|nr:hypothetical protein [Allosaccharopolyspora coralli]
MAVMVVALSATAATAASPEAPAEPRVTFEDHFDGPAGSGIDESRWSYDTGDNVNNHERQWYTSGTDNAALDGNGNLVITAKKENTGQECWYGPCEYTSARLSSAGKVHPGPRSCRGAHENAARAGNVAGVLDAR